MAALTWGGISLWSSPPTWDYTYSGTVALTSTTTPAATGLNLQTVTVSLTSTASTTAGAAVYQYMTVALTNTPLVTGAAFQGQIAQAYLTVTATPTAQANTRGVITPVTVTGTTIIVNPNPTSTAYWGSFPTWDYPLTYNQPVGSATISPAKV